ncbi:TIGR01244 family sulfur transferase [Sphingomonas sp.]|uniref:TIGR01244 family sulfur transferase n=1 Tax=Sphingomonas sp. TaxID=28214 RepID=UPI0025D2DF92|nr:TIGR01244 family sulfur transferase [Sphingomonas sp.]
MFRTLDEKVLVSPQIGLAEIAQAKAQGVVLIVNNRPDGESPDEPQGAEIEAAARAAGIDYIAIPVGQGGFGQPQLDAMAAALENAEGPVLAYCRSGTRSTLLWSLARAQLGDNPAILHEKANAAGYDLTPVAALVDMLAAKSS